MEEELDQTGESMDVQIKFQNRTKSRTSLSLFDLAIEVVPPDKMQKTEYEENLMKEASDWNNLLKEKIQDVEKAEKEQKKKIDKNILTATQRGYIDQMPDLQKFVKESNDFCINAYNYLQENEGIVQMHDQLTEYCKNHLDKVAANVIYETFSKHKTRIT